MQLKIECLERVLPGTNGAAIIASKPHLLGFNVRNSILSKVLKLRVLMGPEADLSWMVTRCPPLLTMSSRTVEAKVEMLQNSLPPGLSARWGEVAVRLNSKVVEE